MRALSAPVILVLSIAAACSAASPNLGAIRPVGGQRGTEIEVNLLGARLGDAQEILYYQPGIQTLSLTKVADNHVKARLKIAEDCSLGLHDLRLRTATGVSELRTFSVGPYPEVGEVEPNNEFAKPQVIALNTTVNGVAENEDVDFYVVEAKKGQRLSAEVEGARVGSFTFDPYVAIMDARRFELAASDDAALVWQDAFASVVVPEDGRYVIQVRESAYAGNANCLYRLHVGDFPRFSATVPMGGKLGETVAVRWIGDVLGEQTTNVLLPSVPQPGFGLFARDDKGMSPYPNLFRLSPFGNVIEKEPNGNDDNATPFTAPMALNGVIGEPNDYDIYTFKPEKGWTYDVRVFARSLRSPLDSVMYVGKRKGPIIAGNDDLIGPDSYLRFTTEDAEYVIHIHDHLRKGGPDYAYRIEVTPVAPTLAMSLPNEMIPRGTPAYVASVPRGNRQAMILNATRTDFGGDLKLLAQNLPPGMNFQADVMAGSLGTYPVLFEANPDAPLGGRLAKIVAEPVDGKIKLAAPSEFRHVAELVNGQNNIPYWTRTVDSMAAAVTEECPYTIEIIEPKVPIVRGGSMGLKVKAIRKPDFKAAIAVSLPWNPPGLSSSGGVTIPEGQNEAVIPITADGGAELRTWKIVVNGNSSVASGPIMVSTQLANLTVAAPFVQLGFQNAAVEQGKETDVVVKVVKQTDFPGEATMTLIGLPNKAATDVKMITKETQEIVYHVKTDPATPAGNHQGLFCQVVVTQNGEPIVHNLGGMNLRVDVPIPPKVNAPAPPAAAAPPPPTPKTDAPKKVLSRLEQLRLEQQKKTEAAPK